MTVYYLCTAKIDYFFCRSQPTAFFDQSGGQVFGWRKLLHSKLTGDCRRSKLLSIAGNIARRLQKPSVFAQIDAQLGRFSVAFPESGILSRNFPTIGNHQFQRE